MACTISFISLAKAPSKSSRSRHSRRGAWLHHIVFEPNDKERVGKEEAGFCFFYEFAFYKCFL